ncbi:hypothetical protein B0J13DRAFT_261369 [Dactylonectria estremocensis]|uniref:Uncharacterized protein n=1 Tax=Dactylonectria estremocensis TaxID=1079267 RepID=A0A9P9F2I8_9HYPO|nr:hypothetical protein B0J13DRAFT_261369 [Dactylonectria estremocensis]
MAKPHPSGAADNSAVARRVGRYRARLYPGWVSLQKLQEQQGCTKAARSNVLPTPHNLLLATLTSNPSPTLPASCTTSIPRPPTPNPENRGRGPGARPHQRPTHAPCALPVRITTTKVPSRYRPGHPSIQAKHPNCQRPRQTTLARLTSPPPTLRPRPMIQASFALTTNCLIDPPPPPSLPCPTQNCLTHIRWLPPLQAPEDPQPTGT